MPVVIKQVVPNFTSAARTLRPEHLGEQPSGWTITGEIHEDYYEWVNYFDATHPTLGWVRGDYESEIEASSMKAYTHFINNHPPEEWDYHDI